MKDSKIPTTNKRRQNQANTDIEITENCFSMRKENPTPKTKRTFEANVTLAAWTMTSEYAFIRKRLIVSLPLQVTCFFLAEQPFSQNNEESNGNNFLGN